MGRLPLRHDITHPFVFDLCLHLDLGFDLDLDPVVRRPYPCKYMVFCCRCAVRQHAASLGSRHTRRRWQHIPAQPEHLQLNLPHQRPTRSHRETRYQLTQTYRKSQSVPGWLATSGCVYARTLQTRRYRPYRRNPSVTWVLGQLDGLQ